MDRIFRQNILNYVVRHKSYVEIIEELNFDKVTFEGSIKYRSSSIYISPNTPGFSNYTTKITDEELVRLFLTLTLVGKLGYRADSSIIQFEKSYKSVGREGKGGRVDILVKKKNSDEVFLFIECKEPKKFDSDIKYIDGQLFRLSKQERIRPENLVYYTIEVNAGELKERTILINTLKFPEFEDWDTSGQPIIDSIPFNYGTAEKRKYANVEVEDKMQRGLDYSIDAITFNRLRNEIHDVIWGGGGTNNNDVFIYISKLLLCKIYDELETLPNEIYEFQRFGDSNDPEESSALVERMNNLYKKAEKDYLALPKPSSGPAFDHVKVSDSKIAYVVGRLEGISVTKNIHNGDLLGEFFEQIVSQDFTQSKGQFFTPPKITRFMLSLIDVVSHASHILKTEKDHLGRHRLPYVIDPSCGSGTFLIEYMKMITNHLGESKFAADLSARIKDIHSIWFGGQKKTNWARDFLFGIENNYDLGLAAKVNMVLHGDGSMNTWINNGLLPFENYWIDGRHNILGTTNSKKTKSYHAPTNEQFDLIISNPPFSLTVSPDEKNVIKKAFGDDLKVSEQLFIERWYQLLREDGIFCCVLPENILDTSTNKGTRKFLLTHFNIKAIVSLPYDAFKPFTSTKTSIVLAQKKKETEIDLWHSQYNRALKKYKNADKAFEVTLEDLDIADVKIFMSEPKNIGYKRRKNLPDLLKPNDLYSEDNDGFVKEINVEEPKTVLEYYFSKEITENAELGFYISLKEIVSREAYRLDPKYCWLWYKQKGIIGKESANHDLLSNHLDIIPLTKLQKGSLESETQLVDLDNVLPRGGKIINSNFVTEIGSDRVKFKGAELIFSKLEPYLGKVIIDPPQEAIGSSEWVAMIRKGNISKTYLGFLLMHPELCEAYRRLQSGKRHARLDPYEILELRVEILEHTKLVEVESLISNKILSILKKEKEIADIRSSIDDYIFNI